MSAGDQRPNSRDLLGQSYRLSVVIVVAVLVMLIGNAVLGSYFAVRLYQLSRFAASRGPIAPADVLQSNLEQTDQLLADSAHQTQVLIGENAAAIQALRTWLAGRAIGCEPTPTAVAAE